MAAIGLHQKADFSASVLAIVLTVSGFFAQLGHAAEPAATRTDLYGDPLPPGAIARLGTSQFAHPYRIHSWAYLPDGKRIASVAADNLLRYWDAGSGKQIGQVDLSSLIDGRTPNGHFAVTDDGRRAAIAFTDGAATVFDLKSGELTCAIASVGKNVRLLRFVCDDTLLLAFGGPTSNLFSSTTGEIKSTFPAETLIGGASARTWRSRRANLGLTLGILKRPGSFNGLLSLDPLMTVTATAVSQDGKLVAIAQETNRRAVQPFGRRSSYGAPVDVYDIKTNYRISRIARNGRRGRPPNRIGDSLAFSPDARRLLISGPDRTIVWDLSERRQLAQVDERVVAGQLRYAPDGDVLSSADGPRRRIVQWTAKNGEQLRPTHTAGIGSIMASPDGRRILTHGGDGTLRLWNAETGEQLAKAAGRGVHEPAALSSDGVQFALVRDGKPALWDASTLEELQVIELPDSAAPGVATEQAVSVAFSSDGATLAIGCMPSVYLVDAKTRTVTHSLHFDGTVTSSPTPANEIEAPKEMAGAWSEHFASLASSSAFAAELLRFSFDGKYLIAVSRKHLSPTSLSVWSIDPPRRLYSREVESGVLRLAASPNGEMLLVPQRDASRDSTACELWSIETGKRIGEIVVPGRAVMGVEFLKRGRLFTAVWNHRDDKKPSGGTIRFWNPASWNVDASADVPNDYPAGLAKLDEHGRVAVPLENGTVLIYEFHAAANEGR